MTAGFCIESTMRMTPKMLALCAALVLLARNSGAESPYYEGKTITITVGYQAGDGYDIWARLLAAHIGKFISGTPSVIAQNMPGAGSMIAANYIYRVAKPDGLAIGAIGPSLYLDQLLRKKEVHFDWAKFGWLGSTENTPWLLYMKSD